MSILFRPGTGSRIVPLPFSDFRTISNCHPPMSCHLGPRPDCAKQIYYPEKPETHRDQSAKTPLSGGRRERRRREIPASDREIVQIAFVCVCDQRRRSHSWDTFPRYQPPFSRRLPKEEPSLSFSVERGDTMGRFPNPSPTQVGPLNYRRLPPLFSRRRKKCVCS